MATKTFIRLLLCVMVWGAPIKAQVYSGFVMDADSKLPIPYAHIQVEQPAGNGSITNATGKFFIQAEPNWPQPLRIRVSAIGFDSETRMLSHQKSDTIYLKTKVDKLNEITIVANDYERQLLRRVISKIPENYPDWNEHLIGQVTEKGFADSLLTVPLYEAWALIGADKPSYQTRQDFSGVTVTDGGVQTFEAFKESSIRIYAGIYNVHRFDAVQLRFGPLALSDLKDFDFNRLPYQVFDGASILPIQFQNKDFTGTIFINMADTAVHEMHVQYLKPNNYSGSTNRTFLHYKVGYSKYEGRYRLRYINYSTAFDSDERFFLENTFSINSFSKAERPIPSEARANFYDKLIDLVPQNLAVDSAQPIASSRFQKIIGRLSFDYGYAAIRHQSAAFRYTIPLRGNSSISGPVGAQNRWVHMLSTQLNYRITNNWQAAYAATGTQENFSSWGLGILRRQPLGFTGKWVVSGGVMAGQIRHISPLLNIRGSDLPQRHEGSDPTEIVRVTHRETQWHITPQLAVGYRFWKNWNFRISASYIHSWAGQSDLVFFYPQKWYSFSRGYSTEALAPTRLHHTPVMLQVQLIFRGF